VVHALDTTVSCTQSPVSGHYDYNASFTVDITTEGSGTVRYQWGRGTADVKTTARSYQAGPEDERSR
jgi:hypothetical protein